jgi:MFS transporter, DHA1 family, tetracycline resistance protein
MAIAVGLRSVLLGLFANTAASAFLYATLPAAGRGIGLVETQTGAILGIGAVLGLLTAPAWGFMSERWGRRPVLTAALSVIAIAPLTMALMLGGIAAALPALLVFVIMLAARSVQAAFGSAIIPVSQAYVADVTEQDKRTAGMGLLSATISLGTVGGALLVWLVARIGAMSGFATIAAVEILAFVVALMVLREPARHVAVERNTDKIPFAKVWPYFTITALALTAVNVVQPILALRFEDQFGLVRNDAIGQAGAAVACVALGMLFSQAVLAVRLKWPPALMLRIGGAGAVVGLLALVFATSLVPTMAAMAIVGLSMGLVLPGNFASMSLATGAGAQGKVAGVNALAMGIGLAVGPVAGTQVYRLAGNAPFWLACGLAVALCAVAFFATRSHAVEEKGALAKV